MATRRVRNWWSLFVVVAILAAIVVPGLSRGARALQATPVPPGDPIEGLATASVVPAEALLYIAATLDPTSDQWNQSEELIRRAGLGDLLDQALEEAAADAVGEGEDIETILNGEVAFVVTDLAFAAAAADLPEPTGGLTGATPEATTETPAGFAIVVASRDPDAVEELVREEATEGAELRGVEVAESTVGDATIVSAPGDEFEEGTAFVRLGDLLVISATPADLEPFVAVHAGDEASLAELPAFVRVREELPNDFLAYGFTNGPVIRSTVEDLFAAMGEGELGAAELAMIEQGLARLDAYAGFTLWADDPGFRVDTITAPVQGATLPPMPANFDVTLDERVPGDTLLFIAGYDLGPTLGPSLDAIGTLVALAAEEDPNFPLPLPEGAADAEQAGAIYDLAARFLAFNPRTDLVDQLVEEWGLALSVRMEDPAVVSAVLVSGVADEARLNDALSKLAVWVNLLVIGLVSESPEGEAMFFGETPVGASTEQVNGAVTQVIEIPVEELGMTIRLQWGIVDGELVFGIGDGFAEYTGGPAGSLAENPRYQATLAELPAEHNAVFYLDLGQIIEMAMPLIEEEMRSTDAVPIGATPEAAPELPDLSAIQALAAVAFQRDDLQGTSAILYIAEQ